jgi:apolipoprotein N-acyltransferase
MLRAANTGVSGVIDAGGKVLHETPIFERRALATFVPRARTGPTLYTQLGDWVVAACWGLLIAIGGIRVVRRREFKD